MLRPGMREVILSIRGVCAFLAVASLLLVAAGCGDSDDSANGAAGKTAEVTDTDNEGTGDSETDGTGEGGTDSGEGSSDGDDGGTTVEAGSLSKAEFVKQANAICTRRRGQFYGEFGAFVRKEQQNPAKPSEGAPEERLYPEIAAPNFETQIEEISELGTPAGGGEQQVAAILDAFQQVADYASDDPRDFARNIEGRLGELPKLARAYGLDSCAEPIPSG